MPGLARCFGKVIEHDLADGDQSIELVRSELPSSGEFDEFGVVRIVMTRRGCAPEQLLQGYFERRGHVHQRLIAGTSFTPLK